MQQYKWFVGRILVVGVCAGALWSCSVTRPAPVEDRDPRPTPEQPGPQPETVPEAPAPQADLGAIRQRAGTLGADSPLEALQFFNSVAATPVADLKATAQHPDTGLRLGGWLDMAADIRIAAVAGSDMAQSAEAWKQRWPSHPVDAAGFVDLGSRWMQQQPPVGRVAVLLEEEGALSGAATRLRDGLTSAYLAAPGGGELQFYAVGSDPRSAVSAYYQAIEEGADWVVGPLARPAVAALHQALEPQMSALYLNTPETGDDTARFPGSMQFALALSPEAEARALAQLALQHGHRSAIAVVPDNGRGERVLTPFEEAFRAGGGRVIDVARFEPTTADYGGLIGRVLRTDVSRQRARKLQDTLGQNVGFEPTRRSDVDMFFLAAEPNEGRLIRPQFKFHDASDVPVYATGRVFTGRADAVGDRDLDGIIFALAPAQLAHMDQPGDAAGDALVALGKDAWNLVRWLPLMEQDPGLRLRGQAGQWSASQFTALERQPAWAEFRGGIPRPLRDDGPR